MRDTSVMTAPLVSSSSLVLLQVGQPSSEKTVILPMISALEVYKESESANLYSKLYSYSYIATKGGEKHIIVSYTEHHSYTCIYINDRNTASVNTAYQCRYSFVGEGRNQTDRWVRDQL